MSLNQVVFSGILAREPKEFFTTSGTRGIRVELHGRKNFKSSMQYCVTYFLAYGKVADSILNWYSKGYIKDKQWVEVLAHLDTNERTSSDGTKSLEHSIVIDRLFYGRINDPVDKDNSYWDNEETGESV